MTRTRTRLISASLLCTLACFPAAASADKSSAAQPSVPPPASASGVREANLPVVANRVLPAPAAVPVTPGSPGAAAGGAANGGLPNNPATSSGSVAGGGSMGSSRPAPELEQMKVLEGSWRCDGRAPATASGPEHAYRSSWKFKRDLDNFWWAAEYQQVKAKTNPAPLKARGFMTYDPISRSFNLMGMDNSGGTTRESTLGWNGDVVILAGDATLAGKKVPFREVITKKGDREFTWRGEMKVGGDWMTLGEDRCRK